MDRVVHFDVVLDEQVGQNVSSDVARRIVKREGDIAPLAGRLLTFRVVVWRFKEERMSG